MQSGNGLELKVVYDGPDRDLGGISHAIAGTSVLVLIFVVMIGLGALPYVNEKRLLRQERDLEFDS